MKALDAYHSKNHIRLYGFSSGLKIDLAVTAQLVGKKETSISVA